jgi:hypothetical protein
MNQALSSTLRAAVIAATATMAACGGGGGDSAVTGSNPAPNTVALTGTVKAPGGQLAFQSPTGLRRMVAEFFGAPAFADIAGLLPAIGVTVELIEIDAGGNQTGAVLATAVTDGSGNFSLDAPSGFSPASRYVVRASGTSGTLDSIVTDTGNLAVDPIAHVTKEKILATATDLAAVSVSEINILKDEVADIASAVDTNGLTLATLNTALSGAAGNSEELKHMLENSALAGATRICGNVSYQGNPHANILVVARDYGEWVTRNKTLTDAAGNYCLDIAPGDYIVGAINRTDASFAASEWWSPGGNVYGQKEAARVTVGASGTVTRDFVLETGTRIEGTVTANGGPLNGAPLENVNVEVRDFRTNFPLAFTRSNVVGQYRLNVMPTANGLVVSAANRTVQPYASEFYNSGSGGIGFEQAGKLTTTLGATQTIDFTLEPGNLIAACVTDGAGGTGVAGARVRINKIYDTDGDLATDENPYQLASSVSRLRANLQGCFRRWVAPNAMYSVQTRGQQQVANLLTAPTNNMLFLPPFSAQVGQLALTVTDGTNPVSQAKVFVYDTTGNFVGNENTDADGTTTVYAPTTGNYLVEVRIDDDKPYASMIYNGKQSLLAGTDGIAGDPVALTVGATANLTMALPSAGVLSGIVHDVNGNPAGGVRVQVRYGGTTGNDRFTNVITKSDGSYEISLPAGSYSVRAGGTTGRSQNTSVTALQSTALNFTGANALP